MSFWQGCTDVGSAGGNKVKNKAFILCSVLKSSFCFIIGEDFFNNVLSAALSGLKRVVV